MNRSRPLASLTAQARRAGVGYPVRVVGKRPDWGRGFEMLRRSLELRSS